MNSDKVSSTSSVYLADLIRKQESEGLKILKFQTGDPDFSSHESISKSSMEAIFEGHTHYSYAQGIPELRSAISTQINNEICSSVDKRNVLITHGAAQAMYVICTTLFEYDDEALVIEPNWSTCDSALILNGVNPIKISFLNNNVIEALEKAFTKRVKGIFINTPNNPTGMCFDQKQIDEIVTWARRKDLYIIADEVYRFFQFEEFSSSLKFLNQYNKYIFIDSFSKKYAMTGWRIGYIASESGVISSLAKTCQINSTHVSPFIQYGALEAIKNSSSQSYCEYMKTKYEERRMFIIRFLREKGIEFLHPTGAFYFFIKIGIDDVYFSNFLLETYQVAVVPGSSYGRTGKGYIRFSYTTGLKEIKEGLEKLSSAIKSLKII